jgi:hypothetical protein
MTQDDTLRIMREAGMPRTKYAPSYHRLCEISAAEEREECAKICERVAGDLEKAGAVFSVSLVKGLMNTIRARAEL